MNQYSLYINGQFVNTQQRQKVINPSTGEAIAEVSLASVTEVRMAFNAARAQADTGEWPRLPLSKRKEYILKIHQGILDKAQELAQIETENTGKPIKESTFMDIPSSAETFKYFAEHLEDFLKPEIKQIATQISKSQTHLVREPMGVAVLIVPWNYPLLIASWKLAQALAAGNTVILKPSSLTPLSVLALGNIIHEAGLPAGVVNIIVGSGDAIGEQLCSAQDVDMISFTGSNEVGKKILTYSSSNVKKTTMELGGKSASIIFKDADLEAAVNGSLCSIFLNQGQMCTAMSRILVEDDVYDKFLELFVSKAQKLKLGPGEDFETQMGPLISESQRKRVLAFTEKAKREGARIRCGGSVPQGAALQKGFFFEPTVITDVQPSMAIWREEVFGPVVCVAKFSDAPEAVRLANASDFALAASIWSKDEARAKEISSALHAGTIWINTYGMFFNELAYGGFKQSGFGKELGREGLLEYSRLKNIIIEDTKETKPLVSYWYGG
ncbi:MAG: aldehyde dehydrogenase family protein [Candidatus Omnitrophica bacterium]|nr:aldehyde dehydrogenase family protein [Candidatus Omnitrophota bacterium]